MTQRNPDPSPSQDTQQTLEETIMRLKTEIALREKYEQDLENSKRSAELATRYKSQFLANMSHEIRTPLGLILGFTEELIETNQNAPENRHLINIIKKNSEILARLINDILDISKIEAGKLEVNIEPLFTFEFLKDLEINIHAKCQRKGICFHLDIVNELPALFYSDEVRIKQILMNLISNAVNHTDKGGLVFKISYEKEKELLTFDVVDTGDGIDPRFQKSLFEVFNRADKRADGNGLGLALSRELARHLGGDLQLIQSSKNQGAWFQVKIKNQKDVACKILPHFEHLYREEAPPNLSSYRLLVVDDLADNIKLLEAILRPTKANVESTTSAKEAILKAQKNNFDLILLDLQMPEQDGFKTLRDLRSTGFEKEVWAVSADAMKSHIRICNEAGFLEHIPKPIIRADFYRKLHRFACSYSGYRPH